MLELNLISRPLFLHGRTFMIEILFKVTKLLIFKEISKPKYCGMLWNFLRRTTKSNRLFKYLHGGMQLLSCGRLSMRQTLDECVPMQPSS